MSVIPPELRKWLGAVPQKPTGAIGLASGAKCGSFACGGCYQVDEGVYIHPPRVGYEQADLIALDKEPTALSLLSTIKTRTG
jgi:hypothetical protein